MKLFLSSYRIPSLNALIEVIGKKPEETVIAVIPNAKDYYAERARSFKIAETKKFLEELSFNVKIIDLRQHRDEKALQASLESVDAIWVSGGNTFCLREEMQKSGFENIISKILQSGVVYCGESAGAIVAGTSLKGIESVDEPEFTENVIQDGLSLVPYYVLPHADNPNFSTSINEARELFRQQPNYVELKDTDCMIVDGEEMQIIEQSL